jgi:hypothetical protein
MFLRTMGLQIFRKIKLFFLFLNKNRLWGSELDRNGLGYDPKLDFCGGDDEDDEHLGIIARNYSNS